MEKAHHILIYGCTEPGNSDSVWYEQDNLITNINNFHMSYVRLMQMALQSTAECRQSVAWRNRSSGCLSLSLCVWNMRKLWGELTPYGHNKTAAQQQHPIPSSLSGRVNGFCKKSSVIPLESRGNYSATSNNMKLVHWPQPAQAFPRCTKCNSSPINGQCTNHRIAVYVAVRF